MNQDTSLGEKKADLADTDLSKIRPSPIEHREILSEFPDHPYLPSSGSRSLEDKEFQGKETYNKNCHMTSGKFTAMLNCHSLCTLFIGTDHNPIQNERSKRYGPVCFVDMKSRKVEAPRNGKENSLLKKTHRYQIQNA